MSTCSMTDCAYPSALIVVRHLPPGGAVMARFVAASLDAPISVGVPLCIDHAHQALDYHAMSLR